MISHTYKILGKTEKNRARAGSVWEKGNVQKQALNGFLFSTMYEGITEPSERG
jgi:hypothetical protein